MNKVIITGRLTRDPEARTDPRTDSNTVSLARFTLAVDRKYMKEGQDSADFISCVAFNKTAEIVSEYLRQGSKVLVEGRWQTGSYTAQDGTKKYTNDCIADSIEFLDTKKKEPEKKQEGFMEIDLDDDSLPFN